ncbi:MAG TPA: leucine-rich repeat domain-containing protein [Candidatus Borkfalkia faecigallinarum]|uniref:Leucine-rich repeat domain-containing protein n=1 Tax=Candidatus Borkfalkia faecigallinarum TaxID=2838509 RepID=A0A9D1VU24_9FIRM|nr:leucine-rich repeat domain-containing protein [Candidatus Borkfalkia faecigallinarum]
MDEEKVFAAWKEGRAPQPPRGRRVRNGLILLAALSAALLAMLLLPVLFSALDKFHADTVGKIRPGDTRAEVVELLGEPDPDSSRTLLEYRGAHFWRIPAAEDLLHYGPRLSVVDVYDWLLRRWDLPYIAIEMDSFGKVVGVLLDTDCPKAGVAKNKTLRECRLLTDTVEPFAETDLWYAAEYTDGSYYMGIARASYRSDDFGTTRRVEWDDRFGNRCAAEVFIGSQSGNYGEGEDWYITPEFELHILSDAGAQAFLHSGFDRSVIESAVFDYAAETVPESLLNGCYSLREVSLPNGLRTIESSAFADCMSLESIRLPASLESISDWAFSRCSALQAVELPASLREIGPGAFEGCDRLEEIVIPDSVQTIGYSAFSYCTSLRSVRLPAGLREIDAFLFEACSSLEQIELPASVTSVGDYAFSATSLREITIPQGVTSIGELAFANTPLTAAELPSSVTSVGNRAFLYCSRLQQIRLPQGLRTIGEGAFRGCAALAQVDLPASLTGLGAGAFRDCASLRSVAVPGGIGQIEEYTFASCGALERVALEAGITSVGSDAFAGCGALRELILPDTLERIGGAAFANCGDADRFSVVIPASVTYIGERAFWQSWLSEAVFAQPQGWTAIAADERVFVPADTLRDPAAAAALLYDTYGECRWERQN